MAIQYLIHGFEFVKKNTFPSLIIIAIDIFVLAISSYTHEYGHYFMLKYYLPDLKKNMSYTKILFIPVPNMVTITDWKKMNAAQHIIARMTGIIGGLIPLLLLYFYSKTEFYIICFLYLGLNCIMDFYGIYELLIYIIKNKKISLENV